MSFSEPIWLYLTPILLLLFGCMLVYGFRRRDALLSRFAASRLLDQLTEKAGLTRTWIKAGCVILAVAAIGIAFARPQLGVEWSERKARGLDIVFVLDSSKSMLATDLRPTRLDRAKLAIIDLVQRLESDRIGLIAFAGQAFLQTPPTLDYSAFRESLDAIDPNIMTSGGSDLGNALKEASEAFPSENNVKVVILLTDGEDLGGNAIKAAEDARKEGIQAFAIGIGTPEGEYLKIRNAQGIEEFVRDSSGQPVRSQLDETTLQQIAQITGGSYSRLSSDSLDQLYRTVLATLPREERESELQEIKIERFQWALSAAIIFLVLEIIIRRRRSAAIHASLAILALQSISPSDAHAQTDLPQPAPAESSEAIDARSLYNSAYEALNSGNFETAAALYSSALAQTDDLKLQRDALYNMGHATYQQGRSSYQSGDPQAALEQFKKAEALFKSAQQVDTTDASIREDLERATKVRETVEQLIEQQKQQENQQQDDQSEQSEDSKQEGDQSDEQQDQQDGDQQDQQQGDPSQQDQQGDQSQQDQQGQQGDPQDQQDPQSSDSSEQSDPSESEQQPSPEEAENGESSQSASEESTEDPVDDIPQPQAGEESEEPGEESEQSAGVPDPSEGEESEGQTGAGAIPGEPIEGMTEAEAAALLDSLRGKETLLPFIDQQRSGRNRDTRDW